MKYTNNDFCFSAAILITVALFAFSSCDNKASIRTTKEVKKTYNTKKIESIDTLLEATTFEDRDVVASSIYHLGRVLDDLNTRPKKWKLKSNKTVSSVQAKIEDQLLKVYAINDDFNIRLLVMESLNKMESQFVYSFFLECLEENDEAIVKRALIYIRPYAGNSSYNSSLGLSKVISYVADYRKTLVLVAIDTLFFFNPQLSVLETLKENKINWNVDGEKSFMKKMFEEKIKSYQAYLNNKQKDTTSTENGDVPLETMMAEEVEE